MSLVPEQRSQMQRKHIVAVNSAVEFLDFLRELLQDEQFNVTTTNFVPATFDQIDALQPDLLIIDLRIGHQAGWDLLERLQQDAATRQIPVIVISTDPQLLERVQEQQEKFGGQHYLAKPFEVDDLLKSVHELIGQA